MKIELKIGSLPARPKALLFWPFLKIAKKVTIWSFYRWVVEVRPLLFLVTRFCCCCTVRRLQPSRLSQSLSSPSSCIILVQYYYVVESKGRGRGHQSSAAVCTLTDCKCCSRVGLVMGVGGSPENWAFGMMPENQLEKWVEKIFQFPPI